MKSDSEILAEITKDGTIDIGIWPELLQRLISRLETIATDNFPKPSAAELNATQNAPLQPPQLLQQPTEPDLSVSQASAQSGDEEQQQPASTTTTTADAPVAPPSPAQQPSPLTTTDVATATSAPEEQAQPVASPSPSHHPSGLHPDDLAVISELRETLLTSFSAAPPHTVQRLAELLLTPNTHYRSLPKYLRALQRVLSVSSPTTAFPLPQTAAADLANGHHRQQLPQNGTGPGIFGLGSDESLGGALLTPIPWLREDVTGAEDHALSPPPTAIPPGELPSMDQEAAQTSQIPEGEPKEVPKLGAEDVGPQPEGTVFPDPPRTEEEIDNPVEKKDEEMADAPTQEQESKEEVVEVKGEEEETTKMD